MNDEQKNVFFYPIEDYGMEYEISKLHMFHRDEVFKSGENQNEVYTVGFSKGQRYIN